jgi:endonuclease/exonuclease/phosphatase family metal-dependent hydrolase
MLVSIPLSHAAHACIIGYLSPKSDYWLLVAGSSSAITMNPLPRRLPLVPLQYLKEGLFSRPQWQPARDSPSRTPTKPATGADHNSTLSILTYNVWFDNLAVAYRYSALLDLVSRSGADVVCLQEVTNTFIGHLLGHKGVQETYTVVGLDEVPNLAEGAHRDKAGNGGTAKYRLADGMRYGCLILFSHHALFIVPANPDSETGSGQAGGLLTRFPGSRQDRRLLSIRVRGRPNTHTHGLDDLAIGTAHLESPLSARDSLNSSQLREREAQLRFAQSILPQMSVVCGDTNIHLPVEDEMPQRLGYTDAWLQVYPKADNAPHPAAVPEGGKGQSRTGLQVDARAGHTFPTSYKLPRFDQSIEPRRLDRVLLGSHSLRAVGAEVLGMEERVRVEGAGGLEVPYSDHGAVLTRLEVAMS